MGSYAKKKRYMKDEVMKRNDKGAAATAGALNPGEGL
jgi:hypothetical protein